MELTEDQLIRLDSLILEEETPIPWWSENRRKHNEILKRLETEGPSKRLGAAAQRFVEDRGGRSEGMEFVIEVCSGA